MTKDDVDALTVQITILGFVVESLIAKHPKPTAVRQQFDELFGQFQTGPAMLGAPQNVKNFARAYVEKLFSPLPGARKTKPRD